MALAALTLCAVGTAADSPHMAFTRPAPGEYVSGVVTLDVAHDAMVSNVTFYYRAEGEENWTLIGKGTPTPPGNSTVLWDTKNATGVEDGPYDLMANGTLDGGGEADASVEDVIVDNTIPTIKFLTPTLYQRLHGTVQINITSQEPLLSLELYLSMGLSQPWLGRCSQVSGPTDWTFLWDTTPLGERIDVGILAFGYDRAGNEGPGFVYDLYVDNVPPAVTLQSPSDNQTISNVHQLHAFCADHYMVNVAFEWRKGQGTWILIGTLPPNESDDYNYTLEWDLYPLGDYVGVEVRVVVTDDLGQVGIDVATGITIEDVAPEPSILAPREGEHLTGTVVLLAVSEPDTTHLAFSYARNGDLGNWTDIGTASKNASGVWTCEWSTGSLTVQSLVVRAVAMDGSGNVGEVRIGYIEVDNTPPAPRIIQPGPGEYQIPSNYTLVAISDRDTVSLRFHYRVNDSWSLIGAAEYDSDRERWSLLWVIKDLLVDTAICATAVDEVGLVGVYEVADIRVDPGDRAPRFKPSMPIVLTFDEDTRYELDIAPHVDDDKPTELRFFVAAGKTSLLQVGGENKTGSLLMTLVPAPNAFGSVVLQVVVVDKVGQRAVANLTARVVSVPDPPYFIDSVPNIYVHPGVDYSFDYGPYIADPDTPRDQLRIEKPPDEHILVNSSNPLGLIFRGYGEGDVGKVFAFTLVVRDDGGNQVSRTVLVTITNDWVPELRRPLPDIMMDEDVSDMCVFALDEYFFDKDRDTLYYSYGNTNITVLIDDRYPHNVSIILPRDWFGEDIITFRATDPKGALLEDTVRVNVRPVNDPPLQRDFPGIPEIKVHHNASYTFELQPYVYDVDNDLSTLMLTTDDPAHASRSTEQGYVLGLRLSYPLPERTIRLRVTISDGVDYLYINITVTIQSNHAPFLTVLPPSDVILDEGGTYPAAFDLVSAYDIDWAGAGGDIYQLRFEFLCRHGRAEYTWRSGMWVDTWADRPDAGFVKFRMGSTARVDIALADPDWNTYEGGVNVPLVLLLRVKDALGAFHEYVVLLHVLPVNDPPTIDRIPDINVTGVFGLVLRNYVRDPDNSYSSLIITIQDYLSGEPVANAQVYGELLYLDYSGNEPRTVTLLLIVSDGEHTNSTQIIVHIRTPDETVAPVPNWLAFIAVMAVSGGVAFYLSKFIWRRYEPPNVQDVYLVYADGVIIRHLSRRGAIGMDEDLAIAMLTAIQEFVQQSMRSAQLKSMQAGDHNILIERDRKRNFYIAVIHTGAVSDELRLSVNEATRAVQEAYGKQLERWDGNLKGFDGVEEHIRPILKITSARIPEGVRFEMEGITSIEPGKTFLLQGKDVTRTHNIFRGLVEAHGHGLLISRVHPERLHSGIAKAGAERVWLSKTPTKRGVSPSNTTMILSEIATYVRDHEQTVVCLDGLEYLTVHAPVDEVVRFLNELTDMAQVDNFIMMVHVDPTALDEPTLAKLARDMVRVSEAR